MTVTDGSVTIGDEGPVDDLDEAAATNRRRRADRTGVADRPRENRSPAAQRAIDRRRKRATQRSTATIAGRRRQDENFLSRVTRSPGDLVRRVPFVVLVLGILSVGLGLTLWLSTTAAQDSYELSVAKQNNQDLSDRRDALKKEFEAGNSAPEIAEKATKQGMIPAKDVARLVVAPNGRSRVVGEITAATGSPAPPLSGGSTGNTIVPQPGSTTGDGPRSDASTQTAPGADLSGDGTQPSGPIAANVLPQASAPAVTPGSTAVAPQQGGTQTAPSQQAR
ncbi:hypothetical protein [Williamsia phyllosphaerae]|uniref:Cell division protein FtsL n=1 Tax=Williamsia phyllosphaerae TaxID=885042 RepID=A0ABQ1V0B5_9NOCA|nr:hypothetical protein [Williamsia phyllosphaerae]GGF29469.1 hypothetical protein GCM10007298_26760 [Williamsia phyllosphaerae]